jgi:hypothetical protein
MTKKTKDIGASVKAQLLRIARERGDDYQLLSLRHANERLLYRLAISPCASHFVLKGAALFTLVQLGMANSRMKDFCVLATAQSCRRPRYECRPNNQNGKLNLNMLLLFEPGPKQTTQSVPTVGIEPTTRGFSVPVPKGVRTRKQTGKERRLKAV